MFGAHPGSGIKMQVTSNFISKAEGEESFQELTLEITKSLSPRFRVLESQPTAWVMLSLMSAEQISKLGSVCELVAGWSYETGLGVQQRDTDASRSHLSAIRTIGFLDGSRVPALIYGNS